MKLADRHRKWLQKKAKRGVRGYPAGTIAFYGPDNTRASKLVAAIIPGEGEEVMEMRKWFADEADLRADPSVFEEASAFFKAHGVESVGVIDGVFGCPHEEGIDYPEGEDCPQCPFWSEVDRYTGERR